MTTRKRNTKLKAVEVVAGDRDLMKALMKEAPQTAKLDAMRQLVVDEENLWLEQVSQQTASEIR